MAAGFRTASVTIASSASLSDAAECAIRSGGHGEPSWGTLVADYIRSRLARGEFAGEIYEDVRPMWVEVGGQRIRVMPADDTARVAMAAAAAG